MIVTNRKAAHKAGNAILVIEVDREQYPVVGGFSRVFWFANYTVTASGKTGYTGQNKATQIHV